MHTWSMLSMIGLSMGVAGSVLHPPSATGEAVPFGDADVEEMATTRTCLTPRWGETTNACAAFDLAGGASVEIELTKVQDTDNNDEAGKIHFRLFDVKAQKETASFSLEVGKGTYTFKNKSDGLLDLVLHARNDTKMSKQNISFTYEKK